MAYDVTTDLGKVRLLLNDVADPFVFVDTEVQAFLDLEGGNIKLAAALAIDTNAGNEVLASKVINSQDVTTSGDRMVTAMHALAQSLRDQALASDDDQGYFEIVPPTQTCWW